MQTKKIDVAALSTLETASLLDIFEGFYGKRQDWNLLKKRLAAWDSWLLLDGQTVAGCAQLVNSYRFLNGSVILTIFVYRWEYNSEDQICQMLQAIIRSCPPDTKYLLLDVSCEHECNYTCYCRFGFQRSYLTSPTNRNENIILLKDLTSEKVGECANPSAGIHIKKITLPQF